MLGHDPMVTDDVIRQYGGEPVSLDKAFSEADGVLVINDHPDYRAIAGRVALLGRHRPAFVYDSWRILDEAAVTARRRPLRRASATCARRREVRHERRCCSAAPASSACTWPAGCVADGHEVTIVDDFSRGRDDADLAALRAHPVVDVRLRRPDRPGDLGGAAARLGPDLPAGRRRRRAQRRARPGAGAAGQHAGRAAPAGLGGARRAGLLRLHQRGVRRRGRRRHRRRCRRPRTCR